MDTSLFIRNADGIVDQWRAHDVSLVGLVRRERNSVLRRAFVRWQHGHSPLAAICKMHPPIPSEQIDASSFDPGVLGYFTIDTASDDPLDFHIVLPGAGVRRIRIGDIGATILRRVLPIEINNVKCTRCASYQRIEQRIGGTVREYYRLLLPISGDDFRIGRIGCFARPVLEEASSPAMSDGRV